MKIGFLFNHEQVHQVLHSAPVAFEMSRLYPDIEVTLIVSSDAQHEVLNDLARHYPAQQCRWIRIRLPRWSKWLIRLPSGPLPVKKVAMLRANVATFADLTALVATEKTSLLLKTHFGLSHVQFIHTRHGAGDRAIGFDKESGKFDMVLLPGKKVRDRLLAAGQLHRGHYAITGYPKFDAIRALNRKPLDLFQNERLTILYNPHFSADLSSWYQLGNDILEYFYQSEKYNLIFAPHVMLFEKRLQATFQTRRIRIPGAVRKKYRQCSHIHIDTGSSRNADMSYTHAADLYLGDVSSQVYEFLINPRPCVFANPGVKDWENDPNYLAWKFGPVFERIEDLDKSLEAGFKTHPEFLPIQKSIMSYTFDVSLSDPAKRSADAIVNYLQKPQTQ